MNQFMIKRIMMAFLGVSLTGVSVAIFNTSTMGTDPFSSFIIGIWTITGVPYGIVFTAITALLLIGVFFVKRSYIGIATMFNLLLLGGIIELCMPVLEECFPHPSLATRFLLMFIAVVIMCFASSLYFTANLGVSAYDAWALIIADFQDKIPFRLCRIATDIICTAVGFAMGAVVGIGTIVTALGMGPLIEFFNRTFSQPFLYGEKQQNQQKQQNNKVCI